MGDIKEKDKKEEITVSVLVAVYNGEKYLEQCLSSLLAQTLQNVQIICVDDCSTDSSLEILHKYQQIDDRVEVIHLEKNQGQGHARNVALSQAKGKYICFLDSDDTCLRIMRRQIVFSSMWFIATQKVNRLATIR